MNETFKNPTYSEIYIINIKSYTTREMGALSVFLSIVLEIEYK